MLDELKLLAPMFLYLPGSVKKHYLSFNNYHNWPVHIRTALRRSYGELIKKQLKDVSGRFYGDVQCTVTLHAPKDSRIRDTDDHCFLHAKWANDALKEAGVYNDDRCVVRVLLAAGEPVRGEPYLTVSYMVSDCDRASCGSVSPAAVHSVQPLMDPVVAARNGITVAEGDRDLRSLTLKPKRRASRR